MAMEEGLWRGADEVIPRAGRAGQRASPIVSRGLGGAARDLAGIVEPESVRSHGSVGHPQGWVKSEKVRVPATRNFPALLVITSSPQLTYQIKNTPTAPNIAIPP